MHHSRTDTTQDDLALRCLSDFQYKVYRYLVNRADVIGVCYPAEETIAAAINGEERSVRRALQFLNDNDVIRYRRKNAFDPVTRRKVVNVYQVNPDIIVIAQEFEAEARSEWDALILQCGNVSTGLWSPYNHHQEPTPEPTPVTSSRTNTTNDQNALTETGQKQGQKQKGRSPGFHNDLTHQREAPGTKSSVPPPRPKYVNPKPINETLPDPVHEQLAISIRDLGIGLPLARGFVSEYGYDRSKSAFAETVLMGEDARKPAAVFRAIIQTRLADEFAVSRQKFFNQRNQ